MTPTPPNGSSPHTIIAIATAFWSSKVLLSAIELGLFTELSEEGLTADELCVRLDIKGRGAPDFFDVLVSLGLLERTGGVYRNTAMADEYLNSNKPESDITGYLAFLNSGFGGWSRLAEGLRSGDRLDFSEALAASGSDGGAVRTGTLVPSVTDSDTFAEAFATGDQVTGFVRAMTGYSMGANRALATAFDWSHAKVVVDVGCSEGALLGQVLAAHPHLHGVGFDLPAVSDRFSTYLERLGVADRSRFVAGDFLTDPMPSGDVLVMGHVLHDWDPATKRMLIGKAYEALAPGGSLLVYESLIDDDRRANTMGMLISLNVSLVSVGGQGYTGAECQDWMTDAGFTGIAVTHLDGPEYMVVGTKP